MAGRAVNSRFPRIAVSMDALALAKLPVFVSIAQLFFGDHDWVSSSDQTFLRASWLLIAIPVGEPHQLWLLWEKPFLRSSRYRRSGSYWFFQGRNRAIQYRFGRIREWLSPIQKLTLFFRGDSKGYPWCQETQCDSKYIFLDMFHYSKKLVHHFASVVCCMSLIRRNASSTVTIEYNAFICLTLCW